MGERHGPWRVSIHLVTGLPFNAHSVLLPEQAMGRWVMGQCMLTYDPPLFYQPSHSKI